MNIIGKAIFSFICAICVCSTYAQTVDIGKFSNEQLGSIYYAYPSDRHLQTSAPEGYVPFYISHYGRHGSRWITSDDRYEKVLTVFETNALTPLGEDVKKRLQIVWEDAKGRSGDLTPLGERQHKQIAERMYKSFPSVFSDSSFISARSSTSGRCMMSMAAFSERLKELNPKLRVVREANQRYMDYLAYTTDEGKTFTSDSASWRAEFRAFEKGNILPQRLISSLFKNPENINNPRELMMGLYWIASDMQNTELDLSFYDIFEKQELFNIWQTINYRMYISNACAPINEGIMPKSASSLLNNIIESADEAIAKRDVSATLRFGHDTYLIRLLALMQIEGCCIAENDPNKYHEAWQDFQISPMAANLQLIFFENEQHDILVKFLLNEKEVNIPITSDIAPFYRWDEVRSFYHSILNN